MRTPLLLGLLALPLGSCSPGPAPAERVILLSCDTLRADRLGLYGYELDVSPRLDAFAEECAVFEEAYASAPMTQPAVSSLLTGRLPLEVGTVPGNLNLMPPEVETLAERLRANGFATAAVVSNWILRRQPADQGDVGVQQGFDHFDDRMRFSAMNRHVRERTAGLTTDSAIEWLEGRETDRFFLWVHYQDPHGPYTPPREYAEEFHTPSADEPPVPLGDDKLGRGQIPGYQVLAGQRNPDVYRDRYDAEIRFFDAELGRLFDHLEAQRLLDGALVLFTADHGEAMGEHDYWFCHGETVHREIVRVPLLMRWPDGEVPATYGGALPARVERLASHLDVVPTILHAVGLFDPGARGVSLFEAPPPEARVLPQDLLPAEGRAKWFAASDGRYRLLWGDEFEAPRLFDVRSDPAESRDLAAEHPELVEHLRRAHREFIEASVRRSGSSMQLDAEEAANLEALGYGGYDDGESGSGSDGTR